jgi:hypothetical protein
LQVIDSLSGSDISFSSNAACYDMLIGKRLNQANINVQSYDEARNFLSLVAYRAYVETGSACLSRSTFEDCLCIYEEQFLSSKAALRQASVDLFLKEEDHDTLRFVEEYLWFFLCARYVVHFLQAQDHAKYMEFVQQCTANIFQRKFANIVIYIAYFSNDKFVLASLLQTLDGLFSKASAWAISDDTRDLMIGLMNKDQLQIESQSDVTQNRLQLLQERIADPCGGSVHSPVPARAHRRFVERGRCRRFDRPGLLHQERERVVAYTLGHRSDPWRAIGYVLGPVRD